ncbi:MAG: DUF6106 family protein [Butyrivibrio sp.]
MLDGVVECLVPRRKTAGVYMLRGLVFFLDSIFFAVSLFVFLFLTAYIALVLLIIGVGVLITWLVIRGTNIEYEYSFFEGEFTVDKIINKSKRKRLKKVNMDKMEFIAPEGSRHLGGKQDSSHQMFNYSALDPEYTNYVALVYSEGGAPMEITFSPNEELLEVLKRKYPRKVYED